MCILYLKDDHAWRSNAAQAMGSWRKTKLMYHMPEAMIEALRVTALDEVLPGSVLEHIPAWSFYVPLPANANDPTQLRGLLFHAAVDQDTSPMDEQPCDKYGWRDLRVFQANFVFVTLIENTQEGAQLRRRDPLSPLVRGFARRIEGLRHMWLRSSVGGTGVANALVSMLNQPRPAPRVRAHRTDCQVRCGQPANSSRSHRGLDRRMQ